MNNTIKVINASEQEISIKNSQFINVSIEGEPYAGTYEVIPTLSEQRLNTKDKVMTDDVVIKDATSLYEAGKAEGIEQGKQAEYDRFWDDYQKNGAENISYNAAFAGRMWTEATLKPKYHIRPSTSIMIFWGCVLSVDLVEYLNNLGVELDFSNSNNLSQAFQFSSFTRVGILDCSRCVNLTSAFANATNLKTIDKLICNKNIIIAYTFSMCEELENVTFEGIIGQNGLNFQWSTKLSHESLVSIINCLQDKSADTSGTVWKVIVGSENLAKLTEEDLINITTKGWVFE